MEVSNPFIAHLDSREISHRYRLAGDLKTFCHQTVIMLLFRIALLAVIALSVDGGICGNRSQCRCSSRGEIICARVAEAPYFAPIQRPGKRMTMQTTTDFDFSTLSDTVGFDHVLLIGPSAEECLAATTGFPWVTCDLGSSTTERPILTTARPPQGSTATRTPLTSNTSTAPRNATSEDDVPHSSTKNVTGLIAWAAVSGFLSLIATVCILVSLVNLHERINMYTACRDRPMFAVFWCQLAIGLILTPIFWCHKRIVRCPRCCCRGLDYCIRGNQDDSDDVDIEQP